MGCDFSPVLCSVAFRSEVGDYRPISITPLLSKVFEKIVAGKLSYLFGEQQSASSFSVFISQGPENMRCFAHSVSPSVRCFEQEHEVSFS